MIAAFRRGVRFQCTRCGECCTRLRGNVPLSSTDVRRISRQLGLSIRSFVDAYGLHVVDRVHVGGRVLDIPSIELRVPRSGTCVFLDEERRCAIQDVKPSVCDRTPFVGYVAEGSARAWREASSYCPGIGVGKRYTPSRIGRLLQREAVAEEAEIDAILASGGDLGRVLRTELPPPLVRETTIEQGGRHGTAKSTTPGETAERQSGALGLTAVQT
jgi:Fe-S-cluster containining protein